MSKPRPRTHDERILLAHVLNVPLSRLALVEEIDQDSFDAWQVLLDRRASGVPLQHLTGWAGFRTITVEVGPGVFIPRPETEVMVGWALEYLRARPKARVVELCTGSGAISKALMSEHSGLEVHAVELSEEAMSYAARNLSGLGVDLRQGDMADAFEELNGTVDLVIANPPYVPLTSWEGVPAEVRDHDPHLALFSGDDGLDAMQVVAKVAARLLKPGGVVGAEHAEVQSEAVIDIFVRIGFETVRDNLDLSARPRFVTAKQRSRGRISL